MSQSSAVTPAKSPRRGPSIERGQAARTAEASRRQRVASLLCAGLTVAEIARSEGVTERRMRAIVEDILKPPAPRPPAEFLALQILRLNEAMIVAYGAMANGDVEAVDYVLTIGRELERYHGYAAEETRADDRRRAEALAPPPRALDRSRAGSPPPRSAPSTRARRRRAESRLQMAPPAIEIPRSVAAKPRPAAGPRQRRA